MTPSLGEKVVRENSWAAEHVHDVALLLACARTEIDAGTTGRISSLVGQAPDWRWLVGAAEDHGVFPLFYHSLKRTAPDAIPAASQTAWHRKFSTNAARNLYLARALSELLGIFENNGVRTLAYKGPLLATAFYGNLALRKSGGDLDLIVHRRDFRKARELLLSRGYRTQMALTWKDHLIHERGRVDIDLHRRVVPRWYGYRFNFGELWERRTTIDLGGKDVPTFSIEDLLVVLCLDIVKDTAEAKYLGLFKICDVAQVVQYFKAANWDLLTERVEQIGGRGAICAVLRAADELLGISMPTDIRNMVLSSAAGEAIARHAVGMVRNGPPTGRRLPHHVRIMANVRERPTDRLLVMLRAIGHTSRRLFLEDPNNRTRLTH